MRPNPEENTTLDRISTERQINHFLRKEREQGLTPEEDTQLLQVLKRPFPSNQPQSEKTRNNYEGILVYIKNPEENISERLAKLILQEKRFAISSLSIHPSWWGNKFIPNKLLIQIFQQDIPQNKTLTLRLTQISTLQKLPKTVQPHLTKKFKAIQKEEPKTLESQVQRALEFLRNPKTPHSQVEIDI